MLRKVGEHGMNRMMQLFILQNSTKLELKKILTLAGIEPWPSWSLSHSANEHLLKI